MINSRTAGTLLIAVCALTILAHGQSKKSATNVTADSGYVHVISVLADSFPNVSLIVRAERETGEPLWNLRKEAVTITEDMNRCEVINVTPVSTELPFNVGIVFDHSSSMTDEIVRYGYYRYRVTNYGPINRAKKAIEKFTTAFSNNDQLALVGFSTRVDIVRPLTKNRDSLRSLVSKIYANGITAFYDAVDRALELVNEGDGIKVVVALTDGNDNNSRRSLSAVIKKSLKLKIPVYVVGLGDVDSYPLKRLASETKGQYMFASNSAALGEVYDVISQRLKAYYAVTYTSDNYSPEALRRYLAMSVKVDSVNVRTGETTYNLPQSVIDYLENRRKMIRYGVIGMGVVSLVAGFVLFARRRRKKTEEPDTSVS